MVFNLVFVLLYLAARALLRLPLLLVEDPVDALPDRHGYPGVGVPRERLHVVRADARAFPHYRCGCPAAAPQRYLPRAAGSASFGFGFYTASRVSSAMLATRDLLDREIVSRWSSAPALADLFEAFFLSFFPFPSSCELPPGQRNKYLPRRL